MMEALNYFFISWVDPRLLMLTAAGTFAGIYIGAIPGLSDEMCQKLERHRPANLAQAARLDGMTPAALMVLLAHVKKSARRQSA